MQGRYGALSAIAAVVANAIEQFSPTNFDPKSLRVKPKFKTTQDDSAQQKWHCCFNKDLYHVCCRALCIMTAVLGWAVGLMIRLCCDCEVHGTDVQLT